MTRRSARAPAIAVMAAVAAVTGVWLYAHERRSGRMDSARPPAYAGQELERIPTRGHVAALTFDAGANADAVPSILATLEHQRVTATLPHRYLGAALPQAGSEDRGPLPHRQPHDDSPSPVNASRCNSASRAGRGPTAIREVTGAEPRPLFRFPYGEHDQRTLRLVNSDGYTAIGWTVDTLGCKGTSGGMTSALVVSRVRAAVRPGAIVLMHVGSHPTDHSMLDAAALPRIIRELRGAGYQFVDLRTALAAPKG